MAQVAPVPRLSVETSLAVNRPRHSALVRVTHWVTAVSFVVLLASGIAILLAHPRLYWGETGAVGSPSLIDLPLPFVLDVPIRGPGRYLHFLFAWVSAVHRSRLRFDRHRHPSPAHEPAAGARRPHGARDSPGD